MRASLAIQGRTSTCRTPSCRRRARRPESRRIDSLGPVLAPNGRSKPRLAPRLEQSVSVAGRHVVPFVTVSSATEINGCLCQIESNTDLTPDLGARKREMLSEAQAAWPSRNLRFPETPPFPKSRPRGLIPTPKGSEPVANVRQSPAQGVNRLGSEALGFTQPSHLLQEYEDLVPTRNAWGRSLKLDWNIEQFVRQSVIFAF